MRLVAMITGILALVCAPALAADVGFEEVRIGNGVEAPLTVGVWYPTDAPGTAHALGSFTQNVALGAPVAGQGLPLEDRSLLRSASGP